MGSKLKSNKINSIRPRVCGGGALSLEKAVLAWTTRVLPLPSRRKVSPTLDDT